MLFFISEGVKASTPVEELELAKSTDILLVGLMVALMREDFVVEGFLPR